MTENTTNTTETFVDPVCTMRVEPTTAAGSFKQGGETYYFCSVGCLQKFVSWADKEPSGCCSAR